MRRLSIILITGLLLLGGVAYAAIPDAGGVIHGCYLTTGPPQARGALRVIDTEAGQVCQTGEVALTWSQTGPQGAPGEQRYYSVRINFTAPAGPVFGVGTSLTCDEGDTAISGAWFVSDQTDALVSITASEAEISPGFLNTWHFRFANEDNEPRAIRLTIRCADLSPHRS